MLAAATDNHVAFLILAKNNKRQEEARKLFNEYVRSSFHILDLNLKQIVTNSPAEGGNLRIGSWKKLRTRTHVADNIQFIGRSL